MIRKEERTSDRYEGQKGSQFLDIISKQLKGRTSKNSNSRHFSTNKPTNVLNSSDIFSQPQISKPRRGASVFRNSSTSKYAESMGKFRKDFVRDAYINYDYNEPVHRKETTKEQNSVSIANGLNFDQEVGVEDLHYQMVKLQHYVKKIQENI